MKWFFFACLLLLVTWSSGASVSSAEQASGNVAAEALAAIELGQLDEAEAKLKAALASNQGDAATHYAMAKLESTRRNLKGAVASAERAAALAPENAEYQYYLGGQYCASGQVREAVAAYEAASMAGSIPSPDAKARALLSLRIAKLLEAHEEATASSEGENAFGGIWTRRNTGLGSLLFPNHNSEEVALLRQQFEAVAGQVNEPGTLGINAYGRLLSAADKSGHYTGCSYGRWFAIGMTQQGQSEAGCLVTQTILLSGEMVADQRIEGKELLETGTDSPEKCPKAIGSAETLFTLEK